MALARKRSLISLSKDRSVSPTEMLVMVKHRARGDTAQGRAPFQFNSLSARLSGLIRRTLDSGASHP
jgi:hypothetical protein